MQYIQLAVLIQHPANSLITLQLMAASQLIINRLLNQQIAGSVFTTPQEIVRWMGAMQAQDFGMAKWAIGLRLPGLNDTQVEN